jgi:hypothetical protein
VAFTIQTGTLALAKKAVKKGRAKSLSAFVNEALEEKVEREQLLCGQSKTSDVLDASVVLTARRNQALVLTSEPKDLRRLDPQLKLETV